MEKNMVENNDKSVNNNNNNSDKRNYDENNGKNDLNDENKHMNSNDGETAKDIISMKSNGTTLNSQDNIQSKTVVIKKLSSTSPSTSVKQNNWISANPFVNYIRNCRKNEFFEQDRLNFFQFAGTRWRSMSSKEKQPYVNGAALIKKQRLMKDKAATRGQKRKRLSGIMTMKKSDPPSKKSKKNKKKDKNKKRSKRGDRRKKMKRQRLMKNDTESDSGTDNSPETSDNESVVSDEIM